MIKDLPSGEDFVTAGLELFDFAWDTVSVLLTALSDAEEWGVDAAEVSGEYWAATKRRLTTALVVVQQGTEFMLKGKIADVSPYLLLAGSPDKWPSPYEARELSFSQFKTVDAQDLIKLHDVVQQTKLPPEFVESFNALRAKRNTISHSIDNKLQVHTSEVIETILFLYKIFFPEENWIKTRIRFMSESPDAKLTGGEFTTDIACRELEVVLRILSPASVKAYFGLDKKQRRYLCPVCFCNANRDGGFNHRLAVLRAKNSGTFILHCMVCDSETKVLRKDCGDDGCQGNVLSDDDDRTCLTCGHLHEEE